MPTIQTALRMFHFIQWYKSEHHEPPTIAELGKEFGMSSSASVHRHLKNMEALGWIKRERYRHRGIEIVKQESKAA